MDDRLRSQGKRRDTKRLEVRLRLEETMLGCFESFFRSIK